LTKGTKAHVVLSGDRAQHLAIESGKPLEVVQVLGFLKTAYLTQIVRQQDGSVLKSAVEDIIGGNHPSAFEKIDSQNPQDHIERNETKENIFFDTLKHSIVETDDLEQRIAEDYLTRTPETRTKTVVIVHANSDRKTVTELIRAGLKEQGEIEKTGVMTNCLVSKGLTKVECRSPSSYDKNDVVRVGKEYYTVSEKDQKLKCILLKDEAGKTRCFHPEKHNGKRAVEIYENSRSELAIGDVIRLTKTDKERKMYANFEYRVESIVNNTITLNSKDTNELLVLSPEQLKDAHWDYAQTVTGYGVQGDSKPYVLDFELSSHKNLTNQRGFYIAASRAAKHLTIYTDSRKKFLKCLEKKGDKYSGLEVVGGLDQTNNKESPLSDGISRQPSPIKSTNVPTLESKHIASKDQLSYDRGNNFSSNEIWALISDSGEAFVERLLGKPNQKLSTATQWRYGSKGSLAINMDGDKKGLWHNFETGESGNLFSLIKKETGLPFKEALKCIADMSGTITKKIASYTSETHKKTSSKTNSKTSDYAMTLAKESVSIKGTIAEKYLKDTRKIKNLDVEDVKYHPSVFTGKGETPKQLPAMICIGRDKNGKIKCVQATYLDPKTFDKANISVKKRTYSSPSEAAVLLKKSDDKDRTSYIAEGVETGLSIKDAITKGDVLATLGKSNFTSLDPAKLGKKVVFCLDNDGKDIHKDQVLYKAAERLIKSGKDVFFAIPKQLNKQKTDFNDVAKTSGVSEVKHYLDNAKPYKADKKIELFTNLPHKNNEKIIIDLSKNINKTNNIPPKTIDNSQINLNKNMIKSFNSGREL
jgi:phage/plasmid primase-like uncharacterized protein